MKHVKLEGGRLSRSDVIRAGRLKPSNSFDLFPAPVMIEHRVYGISSINFILRDKVVPLAIREASTLL